MTAVKGSKEYQWRVVKYHPQLRMIIRLVLLVGLGVIGYTLYIIGFRTGMAQLDHTLKDLDAAQSELTTLRDERSQYAQELENVKLGGEIDQKSLEQVRLEVIDLRSSIAALEQDNQFYRNLMAPTENKRGLNFGSIEISATDQLHKFKFKVVMQQLAASHELLVGTLNVNIIGRENDEIRVLSLSDVSKDVDSANIKLRFKYFQTIEAELLLPDGFEAEKLELEAHSSGKSPVNIEKRLAWLVQEI